MFHIIFAAFLAIVLFSKYFDGIAYKTKPDTKTIILMMVCTLFVIAVFIEKVLKIKMSTF